MPDAAGRRAVCLAYGVPSRPDRARPVRDRTGDRRFVPRGREGSGGRQGCSGRRGPAASRLVPTLHEEFGNVVRIDLGGEDRSGGEGQRSASRCCSIRWSVNGPGEGALPCSISHHLVGASRKRPLERSATLLLASLAPWGPNGAERRHTVQHRPAKSLSFSAAAWGSSPPPRIRWPRSCREFLRNFSVAGRTVLLLRLGLIGSLLHLGAFGDEGERESEEADAIDALLRCQELACGDDGGLPDGA
jgi:hypothetical protein